MKFYKQFRQKYERRNHHSRIRRTGSPLHGQDSGLLRYHAIILNQQSLDKFESRIKPGGLLVYDPNGITHHPTRTDIQIYKIDAADEAAKMGNAKAYNMIVLGAFLKVKPIVKMENVTAGLKKSLPPRHHNLIPMNEQAIKVGMEAAVKVR